MINTLIKYKETGEILKFIYKGGSQPNTIREALVVVVDENSIRCKEMETNINKEYKIDKIELYDETKHKNYPKYEIGKLTKQYATFDDILTINEQLFENKNFVPKIENKSFKLYEKYKNGNIKKSPVALIEYHEFIYSEFMNENGDFEEDKQPSQNPWCVKVKNKTTRNFKHFDKAVNKLIELIENE